MISFKDSFEYDINHSIEGQDILSQYDLKGEIFSSDDTVIYEVNHKISGDIRLLKAIRLKDHLVFDMDKIMPLHHKGIAKVYDHSSSNKFLYLIKDYIQGIDLESYIESKGPMTERQMKTMILKVCETLNYLHDFDGKSLIYRDLKPSNIIITENQEPILIDTITVREVKENQASDTYYVGSRGYSAPEQFGYMQSSPRADIYSLGATMYYMVSGKPPENSDDFKEQVKHLTKISKRLRQVIGKATCFNPKDRYGNIDDLRSALTSSFSKKWLILPAACLLVFVLAYQIISRSESPIEPVSDNQLAGAFEEDTSEGKSTEDQVIEKLLDLDLDLITPIEEGLTLSLSEENSMKIAFNRELMSEEHKQFKYISATTRGMNYTFDDLSGLIYDSVVLKHGFAMYQDGGYVSSLRENNNLAIIIYDAVKQPIGYYFVNNIKLNTRGGALLDVTSLRSMDDINMNKIPLIEEGVSYKLLEDNVIEVVVDKSLLSDVQKDLTHIVVTTSERTYYRTNFKHEIFGSIVSGYSLEEYKEEGIKRQLGGDRNVCVVIYNEDRVPLGYYLINDIVIE